MPVPLGRVAVSRMATPLPDPLPTLAKSGVHFGRGQLCMIAGAPAAGKTTTALIMAIRCSVPTLYFSADSDEITMAARAASVVSGHRYGTVREAQQLGVYDDLYGEAINALPIRFVFDPSEPSMDDIGNAITAWVELWGEYPQLIVIDNLWNMTTDTGDEWSGMRAIVKTLHWLARRTKACVWLLHHTSEQNPDWITSAPPRSAIQGKLAQLPEVILTMANHEGYMYVGIVKNRHGKSDPHAKSPLQWIVDFTTMRLWDERMMGDANAQGRQETVQVVHGDSNADGWSPSGALRTVRQGQYPSRA
jgi:hypothetical protein